MRVLVTNDDGIASPGLHAMASHLETCGHDVLVVAPKEDMSGASASIGRLPENDLVAVTTVEIEGVSDAGRAIDGPPGIAVIAAMFGAFGDPPELVSGINSGLNTGPLVLHPGTVGAALTAQNFGACAIAGAGRDAAAGGRRRRLRCHAPRRSRQAADGWSRPCAIGWRSG